MKDNNIDNLSSKINSDKTKFYFKEVSNSYYNSNYRAAVVTLYSVVINDVIIKLQVLEEIYNDATAKSILDEVKTFQSAHPNNPDWEKDIIEKVKSRTNLIDNVDYAHILALRNDRHLCAHPVIDKDEKLYTPNQETVAAHIRNMLESLFLKPAILSKKILGTILTDIASKSEILIDEISVEKYIQSKYLNNLNPTTEVSIFRDIWKIVFSLSNSDTDKNRLINYRVLYYLYKKNIEECKAKIHAEKDYFSNILNDGSIIPYFIRFLSENDFLYSEFRQDTHLLIDNHIKTDFASKVVGWFLNKSIPEHLECIKNLVHETTTYYWPVGIQQAYQRLVNISISKGYRKDIIEFIIYKHTSSGSYNESDKTFINLVFPNIKYFNEEEIKILCNKIDDNQQNYGRNQAENDYAELKTQILKHIDNTFDFTKYPRVFK